MNAFFENVLTASFHGSIVILAVLALRLVLRKTPKKFICYLWMLAGIRLLLPLPLQSSFSLQPGSISIPVSVNLSAALTAVWIALAVGIVAYSVVSYLHLRRKVMDAVKVPGGWESDRIETAFVLGFLKPKIYIPAGMDDDTRQQILAHERTHLDKGDHWIKMIGFLALALHWFNPLVWLSYVLLCKDMEMACDERVVQFMELEERKAYSKALLDCSTNHVHYAACPVAFGEVSVKYRIQSVLNYRKPGFWISLLGLVAIAFVALCLVTSPVEDSAAQLRQNSRFDPAAFSSEPLPELEPNPDWGVTVFMDVTSPTGGTMVYAVEERFAAVSESITMEDYRLDKWNGTAWEPAPSLSGQNTLPEHYSIGFAQSRDEAVNYFTKEIDWTLVFGALAAGDYRITQTLSSDTDTADFSAAFRIYREELPAEEEAALTRCGAALDALLSVGYSVNLYETNRTGEGISRVKQITKSNSSYRVDYYLGDVCYSSSNSEDVHYAVAGWDTPYRLNQNRRFLFPEGQSVISQEEITFRSVWTDWKGIPHTGTDTFRFYEDGTLESVQRTEESEGVTLTRAMEARSFSEYFPDSYINEIDSYAVEDTFDAMEKSPWKVFFRVDDDLLTSSGGEVWLGTNAVGVSNVTTDGAYWLEKKDGSRWNRLGGESFESSLGNESVTLVGKNKVIQVDWSADYGKLSSGVYRMGKRFYKGSESCIQYAEFAIYPTGGIFGQGGEEAMARVDDAIEKLQNGAYRVEEWNTHYSSYEDSMTLSKVFWKYGDVMVTDYYKQETYSHSGSSTPEDDWIWGYWLRYSYGNPEYDFIYFADGYSTVSDRQISFVHSYSASSVYGDSTLYTYYFDEAGNLTEIRFEPCDGIWDGRVTRYIITDTSEEEIEAWVEAHKA